jgi:hypothetical protein
METLKSNFLMGNATGRTLYSIPYDTFRSFLCSKVSYIVKEIFEEYSLALINNDGGILDLIDAGLY